MFRIVVHKEENMFIATCGCIVVRDKSEPVAIDKLTKHLFRISNNFESKILIEKY